MKNQVTKYKLNFRKKLTALEREADTKPFWGKKECRHYATPTAAAIFAASRSRGQTLANQIKRVAKQDKKIDITVKAELRKYAYLWVYKNEMTNEEFARHARDLGNTIHDLPYRWTGYETQASIDSKGRCKEHFYPRQWAGCQIMTFIFENEGITFTELRRFFDIFRQVHYTTSDENRRLMPLQEAATFTDWKEAYNIICSPLIQVEDRGPILTPADF